MQLKSRSNRKLFHETRLGRARVYAYLGRFCNNFFYFFWRWRYDSYYCTPKKAQGAARKNAPISASGPICALTLLALGCGGAKPTPAPQPISTSPAQQAALRITGASAAPLTAIGRYSRPWTSRTGVKIEFTQSALNATEAIKIADIALIRPAVLSHLVTGEHICSFPESLTTKNSNFAWRDVLSLYRNHLLVWRDKVFALPVLGEAWLCFYRDDLFRDPAHQQAFQAKYRRPLAAPTTWEQFTDIAEFFNEKPRPETSRLCKSLPSLATDEDDAARWYYSIAAPLTRRMLKEFDPRRFPESEQTAFHFDLETGKPQIAAPGFVEALRLLQKLQGFRSAGSHADPETAFSLGEAVLCLASPAALLRFQAADSRVRSRFGFCPVPGSARVYPGGANQSLPTPDGNFVPYLGSGTWLAVVSKHATNPDLAFDFLAELSGPQVSQRIVFDPEIGGGAFRRQQLEHASGWEAFGLDRQETNRLRACVRQFVEHPQAINPAICLRTPGAQEFEQVLKGHLSTALSQRQDAAQTLQKVSAVWTAILDARLKTSFLRDYRTSLGLAP